MNSILETLTLLDYSIFFVVLLITVITVIFGHKKIGKSHDSNVEKSPVEILLEGRRLTLPLFVATLVSTWYGGIFGVTEIAYQYGIYNFVTQGVFWYITYLIFAFFLVNKLRGTESKTLPELVGSLFGKKSKFIASIFNIFNVIPVSYAMSIGIFLSAIFSIPVPAATLLGTLVVVIYSMFGGFRAIVLSDLVQFFVMVISVITVLIFSIYNFGGLEYLTSQLPESHFSITGGQSISTLVVWGIIALSTLVDPNFYQRVFAAKSVKTARNGIILSTLVWIVFDICTTAGAMYAAAHIKEADPSSAYLVYAMEILPNGFRGFFLAGILATILSTLDSYLFIASTTLIYDLLGKRKAILPLHHLSTLGFGLIAAFLSFYFTGGIKEVWKTLGSYSAGCLLAPMLIGMWTKIKISDFLFSVSSIFGVISITIWRQVSRSGFWKDVDDLYIGVFSTLLVILVGQILTFRQTYEN